MASHEYEAAREERVRRNREEMARLIGKQLSEAHEAAAEEDGLPGRAGGGGASGAVAVRHDGGKKERRRMETRGAATDGGGMMMMHARRKSSRIQESGRPRVSYRDDDDDDDGGDGDESDGDDDLEFVEDAEDEEDDDVSEDEEDTERKRRLTPKCEREGQTTKGSLQEQSNPGSTDSDEDGDFARAIALSLQDYDGLQQQQQQQQRKSGQSGYSGRAIDDVRIAPNDQSAPPSTASGGPSRSTPRKKKGSARPASPRNWGAAGNGQGEGNNDIPDGPLINLFHLVSGGGPDNTIGIREIMSIVKRDRSLLDASEFTVENINNMIVAANAMYGDASSESTSSAVNLQTFAALVRGELPRLFENFRAHR